MYVCFCLDYLNAMRNFVTKGIPRKEQSEDIKQQAKLGITKTTGILCKKNRQIIFVDSLVLDIKYPKEEKMTNHNVHLFKFFTDKIKKSNCMDIVVKVEKQDIILIDARPNSNCERKAEECNCLVLNVSHD